MASVKGYTGLATQVLEYQEDTDASANDWYVGDLVKSESGSGQIVIATAGAVLGIAQKTAAGDDGYLNVELINLNEIYVSDYNTTTAQSLIGDVLDYTFTAGAHTLATGGTTDVYCVGLHPGDAVGTDGGRLLVRFIPTCVDGSY